ncbi:hypothetical protein V6U90_31880 [Micromonospora sp. CPCC 206060]|uniref:hypothetical protein n=1 Tax=Micromonospora sp. CPCC 206060 TaxID=3122406 RepID=UPI002FF19043
MPDHTNPTGPGGLHVICPPWCRGCGPNDPMHRSELVTIGREQTGWISLQLLVDRFHRRDLVLKLDSTRFGATQTVLLSGMQTDRLIRELVLTRQAMRATNRQDEPQTRGTR